MRSFCAALILALAVSTPSGAGVTGIDIAERKPFADGMSFGDSGPYEKIRGIAHFALDPNAPANASIVDLKRAPRDAHGLVVFTSEFVMLRPAKASASTLLYDVNNRGHIAILGQVDGKIPANNDPTTVADAGDGFLMRHGFTLLFSAWTWDVAPGLARRPAAGLCAARSPPCRRLADPRACRKRIHGQCAGRHRDLCRHAGPHLRAGARPAIPRRR